MPTPDERFAARLKRYVPRVAAALIRSTERALSAFEQGASPAVASAYVNDTDIEQALTPLYVAVAVDEAGRTYRELTEGQKAAPPTTAREGWLARARRFLRGEGSQSIKGITERTREIVQDVLTEALVQGLGIREAAKELRERVAGVSRARATAIVRTELLTASNFGSLIGAQSTGLKLNKRWLATSGARTRQSHQEANGQTVGLDAFFRVGSGQGRYPGDPLLPVDEKVNCRCTQTYVPIEE